MPIIRPDDKSKSSAAEPATRSGSRPSPRPPSPASTAPDYLPPAASAALAPMREEVGGVVEQARQITLHIDDQPAFDAAGRFVIEVVRPALARIDEALEGPKGDAYALHKKLVALHKKEREPWERAEEIIEQARRQYRQRERERQEAERRRLEAEHQQAAEVAARQAVRELVEQGEEEGAREIARALVDNAIVPTAALPTQVYKAPKTAGTSVRKAWKYRMVDPSKVVRAFLVPDEQAIRATVGRLGVKAVEVVGEGSIEVYEDEVESFRRT